jgi:hypothetical protein
MIAIHFASYRKPSQKEGSRELKGVFNGRKRKTVATLNKVKIIK